MKLRTEQMTWGKERRMFKCVHHLLCFKEMWFFLLGLLCAPVSHIYFSIIALQAKMPKGDVFKKSLSASSFFWVWTAQGSTRPSHPNAGLNKHPTEALGNKETRPSWKEELFRDARFSLISVGAHAAAWETSLRGDEPSDPTHKKKSEWLTGSLCSWELVGPKGQKFYYGSFYTALCRYSRNRPSGQL